MTGDNADAGGAQRTGFPAAWVSIRTWLPKHWTLALLLAVIPLIALGAIDGLIEAMHPDGAPGFSMADITGPRHLFDNSQAEHALVVRPRIGVV